MNTLQLDYILYLLYLQESILLVTFVHSCSQVRKQAASVSPEIHKYRETTYSFLGNACNLILQLARLGSIREITPHSLYIHHL